MYVVIVTLSCLRKYVYVGGADIRLEYGVPLANVKAPLTNRLLLQPPSF